MLLNSIVGCLGDAGPQLSKQDHRILDALIPVQRSFGRNTRVFDEDQPSDYLLLVERGLSFTFRHQEDGSRQIIDIHFPGELVGLDELSLSDRLSGLMTLTETSFLFFRKAEVLESCAQSPALSEIMITLVSRGQARLTERMVGLARHSARQRIAHFLLEVRFRVGRGHWLRSAQGAALSSAFLKPEELLRPCSVLRMPQAVIADTLGLSSVHVNRVLREFRERDLICSCGHGISLSDIEGLKDIAGWEPGEHWYGGQPVMAIGARCFAS